MPGYDLNPDDRDLDDVNDWMAQRQKEVDGLDEDLEAGRDAWSASTATGQNLAAASPDDVRALGADANGQDAAAQGSVAPIKRGNNAKRGDGDYAGVVFNETRSLAGPQADQMRLEMAHALMNADETWGDEVAKYARTAPTTAHVPDVEKDRYDAAVRAVAAARAQRAKGLDPTNGAVFYQFLPAPSKDPWQGRSMKVGRGPFDNSYPHGKLGPSGVYWYAY
jgi:hypothetical protein